MNDGEAPWRRKARSSSTQAFRRDDRPRPRERRSSGQPCWRRCLAVGFSAAYEAAAEIRERRGQPNRPRRSSAARAPGRFDGLGALSDRRCGRGGSTCSIFAAWPNSIRPTTPIASRYSMRKPRVWLGSNGAPWRSTNAPSRRHGSHRPGSGPALSPSATAARGGHQPLRTRGADRFSACALEAWRKLGADGVIAVRHAARAQRPPRSSRLDALRAEVGRAGQRQQERETELETARLAAGRAPTARRRASWPRSAMSCARPARSWSAWSTFRTARRESGHGDPGLRGRPVPHRRERPDRSWGARGRRLPLGQGPFDPAGAMPGRGAAA